jgi:hypothetical protein
MELELRLSRGFRGTNDLNCRRASRRKPFVVRADEKLTAFLELEAAILTERGQKPLPCHRSSFRAIHRKGFALCFLK